MCLFLELKEDETNGAVITRLGELLESGTLERYLLCPQESACDSLRYMPVRDSVGHDVERARLA